MCSDRAEDKIMGHDAVFKSLIPFTRRTIVCLAGAWFLAACAAGGGRQALISGSVNDPNFQPDATKRDKQHSNVKVAVLLPLSAKGNTANVAKAMKQAGELALFEFDNPNIVLITKDTKGTPEGAREAAESAIKRGAELIIGPLFAKSVVSVAPIARRANVPVIGFSSDESVAGNGVYLLSFLAGRDVPRIVSYAVAKGKKNFVALVPDTAYGRVVRAAFQKAVSANGAQVLAVETYPLDANGMLEPARKVSEAAKNGNAQIDALLIPGGSDTLPTLSPLIPYFEIDTKAVQLMGTGRWDFANIGRQKSLLGGWFPAPDPRGWREFTQRYVKTYGSVPPRIASLSYDAVSLAVSLSSNPPGKRYSAAQITRPSGFAGVDGLFRLLPDGSSERGLAILEVQKFGSRVIDAAPNVFGQAQF
jgi:ABC-type branched-subunit amino acid transport system substrate-binding protein